MFPSSTSSRDSFHGTAISITQHTTNSNPGIARYFQKSPENGPHPQPNSINALPESYTNVPPISLPANVAPTVTGDQVIPASADMNEDQMQIHWFDKVTTALANETHSPSMVKHGTNPTDHGSCQSRPNTSAHS